ncbi:ECF-type sigma factor [Symmachiella dynata]|uniref:ECF-type sigma factor n=1 Tax=Symmachiella dynata TaxID=2527995 RepID=UPI0030ED4F7E
MGDVTRILSEIESGDKGAAEKLLPLVYEELRRLAAAKMAGESPEHTLQPTALVHDAYVRMVDVAQAQNWNSRGHFFAAAAEAMRRILVERARSKHQQKRGGDRRRVELNENISIAAERPIDLLALDEALAEFESREPRKAALVKLRFFAGMTRDEAASALGISSTTADRYWTYARLWLYERIERSHEVE